MAISGNTSIQTIGPGNYVWFGGAQIPYSYQFTDTFSQTSISHGRPPYGGESDVGGPWIMERVRHVCDLPVGNNYWIQGPQIWHPVYPGLTPGLQPMTHLELIGEGTKAISLTAPTVPTFNMSQELGELREGAPRIIGTDILKERTRAAKAAGSEYLNVEFGWKPLVSDVQNLAYAVKHSDSIIDNYRAGSGQKIRKRHAFPTKYDNGSSEAHGVCELAPIVQYSASGTVSRASKQETWFSGAFRYYVPVGDDTVSKVKEFASNANHLLGVNLTPDVMWNLAPWSWAADWFANTGDIMTNISALGTDGLAMQYGYIMSHTENTYGEDYQLDGPPYSQGSYAVTTEQKIRVPATPYGFGLTFDGFSDRQKAIVAALGLSRGRR
jgi:hypothetical protein